MEIVYPKTKVKSCFRPYFGWLHSDPDNVYTHAHTRAHTQNQCASHCTCANDTATKIIWSLFNLVLLLLLFFD